MENFSIVASMPTSVWKDILTALEPKYSRPNFVTWLKPTKLIEEGEGLLTITVPNEFAKSWVEKHALSEIKKLLEKHYMQLDSIRLVVTNNGKKSSSQPLPPLLELEGEAAPSQPEEIEEPTKETAPQPVGRSFNPHYTFETFIVGNNNRLAFAASQVVSERPGQAYNPLFIYGGVGLGKTHLMQAIGNTILQADPKKKIIYISCETFTSEFINALQNKSIDSFKRKYRSVDVFLVDDIQFLANKEGTQEEFFHTFNMLHQGNRQIVITSDRVPKEIPGLEERLISRLGWGMIADIQTPNYETRVAILQEKAKERGVNLPPEVLSYIASTITSNVREMEGSLLKLITTAEVEKVPVTVELAKRCLQDLVRTSSANLTSKQVIRIVAEHFNIETSDILGKKRVKELVYPRQIVMYLLREFLHQSYPQIGEALGGKDHTTVMHGVEKISKARKTDPGVEKDLINLQQQLYT